MVGRHSCLPFDRLTALSFYRMGNVEGLSEVEGPIAARQPVESLWVERECLAHQIGT